MSKSKKIWLGIFTFLPLVFFIAYFIFFFLFFFSTFGDIHSLENNPEELPLTFMGNFAMLFVFILLASFGGLVIMIYYIIHANNNPANDSNKKLMWILILIFTSSIGSIVYYFIEILPKKETQAIDTLK